MNNIGRIAVAVLGGLAILFAIIAGPMMVENLDASEIMVIQSVGTGKLTVYTEPGWKPQLFGDVTKYPRRNEFRFHDVACKRKDGKTEGAENAGAEGGGNGGLGVRFYDGGNATLCGTISWEMPLDPPSVIEIHRAFRSPEAVETQAIRRAMESAAYFSGPTMSSLESAAGRRNELLQIINDQMINGVYRTTSKTVRQKDLAGVERDMVITEIDKDTKGMPIRAQESYVKKYNISMLPITISAFAYETKVEEQIREQQAATNAVQVAAANARRAEQDARTAAAKGEADATKAEWEQKTIAAKAIADAQAKVTIAKAQVEEAEAFKKSEILRGQGEAERKRLVMEADGQLDKRLEAVIRINELYADAIKSAAPGAWSPQVVMGGAQGGNAGSNAQAIIDLMTAKTAREVGVDLRVQPGKTAGGR